MAAFLDTVSQSPFAAVNAVSKADNPRSIVCEASSFAAAASSVEVLVEFSDDKST
jgi:hypothetical protein